MSGTLELLEHQKERTCCIAGHEDIPADKVGEVRAGLEREINQAIADGYVYFMTDLMDGADQLFAEVVRDIREKEGGAIQLVALLPHSGRRDELMEDTRAFALLAACREVGFACEKRIRNSITVCRRKTLQQSSRMIAVYDGRENGGTVSAIRMAHLQRVQVREIPLGL